MAIPGIKKKETVPSTPRLNIYREIRIQQQQQQQQQFIVPEARIIALHSSIQNTQKS